jgi:ribosomal protein S18 acetylase RimI-like enzyme
MTAPPLTIAPASGTDDLASVAALFREYGGSLGIDLSFQQFEEELASLPGEYAEPRGALLLARAGQVAAGCVGLRPLDEGACEMKRLFVRPQFRGRHLGEALVHAAIDAAHARGYARMRLDTLPTMATARRLYQQLGFREIPAYRFNPIEGTTFLERTLTR